ncbi:MAG: glycosyltransferase family 39 protein [Candidatus Acidiferrales bacterium]
MKPILKRAAASLALILLVALALRVAHLWEHAREIPHHALGTVPFLYEPGNIAYSVATGGGFSSPFREKTGPTAWDTPVYPLLIAAMFQIFGTYTFAAYLATVSLNILFSTFTCVPLFFAGRRIGGASLGAATAWLWAFFPNAVVIPTDWVWDTSLSALLAAIILWSTLEIADSRRVRDWILYGLLWGLTLMTNPTLASLLPLLLGWAAWRAHRRAEKWLGRAAISAAIVALCCVPWTARNFIEFDSFVPFRSVLGLQLWLGNNDAYKDAFPGYLHPIDNSKERKKYVAMGEIAYMAEKKHQAITWMEANPARVTRTSWERFVGTWLATPTPWRDFRATNSLLIRTVFVANFLAAIGTLVGIVVLWWRRSEFAFPVTVFPLIFPWPFYLSQSLLRYRHPIDPILMLLTAIAVVAAWQRISLHPRQPPTPESQPRH